jgi:hypothetical protein
LTLDGSLFLPRLDNRHAGRLNKLCAPEGVAPALTTVDADFPGYLTAARIARDAQDTSRLYDDRWFRQQMRRDGFDLQGNSRPFPPPTALLLVPLARFAPLTALRLVTLVSVLCLLVSLFVLARLFGWGLVNSALFVLTSFLAVISGLRLGQPYTMVSTLCILGYYLYRPATRG